MTTQPADWADAAPENVPYVARRTEPDAPVPARFTKALLGVLLFLAVVFIVSPLIPVFSEWMARWIVGAG